MILNVKGFGNGILALAVCIVFGAAPHSVRAAQDANPAPKTPTTVAPSTGARVVGILTAVQGNALTIKTDAGAEATVTVGEATRILETLPGQKDLSSATTIHPTDLAIGDRVLARTTLAEDGKTYLASTVIAMKQADLAQKHLKDREAWQQSGEGGLVKAVDPSAQTVTISVMGAGGSKTVVIRATASTITRRYAADSIEFDDARPAPLSLIKAGDQLRARGTRSANGSELQADEIVSGTFRNVVATVTSVDVAAGTLTVADLVAKTAAVIRVTHDSQLRKLPPMMAQGLAMRLKNGGGGTTDARPHGAMGDRPMGAGDRAPGMGDRPMGAGDRPMGGQSSTGYTGGARPSGAPDRPGAPDLPAAAPATSGTESGGGLGNSTGTGQRPRGPGDLQQALSRAPIIQLSDLQKGDAIMVVTTEGSPTAPATAVTLLAGVEPMLQASATGSRSMLSSSWNLNAPGEAQ